MVVQRHRLDSDRGGELVQGQLLQPLPLSDIQSGYDDLGSTQRASLARPRCHRNFLLDSAATLPAPVLAGLASPTATGAGIYSPLASRYGEASRCGRSMRRKVSGQGQEPTVTRNAEHGLTKTAAPSDDDR